VLGLALFIDPASLEFRKPSAEFGQLGRREPQDRFFDIFDCHGRRNSTPALELEEQWPANRDVCLSAAGDRGWPARAATTGRDRLRGWACRTRSAPGDRQGVGGASPLR